ncbi:hypothetical protein ACH5RR_019748 [Cinchona calisaya]|uniref:UBA domain-containing protein n=1 Tax=Cinchona calisaya TaxID=153742 RepID=A0ABD2ZR57_9GENT
MMEYDFRNKKNPPPPYDSQIPPMHRPTTAGSGSGPSSTHPMYANHPSFYPKVGQPPGSHSISTPPGRNPSFHHHTPSPAASSPGIGIRVALKPEYRISPPPQLSPQVGDIPRSNFHFDFDFERKILAEAEKESQNWGRLGMENLPSKMPEPTSSLGSTPDPIVSKYIASGLSREAVYAAVANYGDNPAKVKEFANGYTLLREMGFSSSSVAEALLMYDNDTDKALAHFLNTSS